MLESQHKRIWSAMQSPSRAKYVFTRNATPFWIPLAMSNVISFARIGRAILYYWRRRRRGYADNWKRKNVRIKKGKKMHRAFKALCILELRYSAHQGVGA